MAVGENAANPTSGDGYIGHYISGTHWDREWYRPFEEYRILLVDILDMLLDLMGQDSAFQFFHLDGQTCMIDDYLEIRPERRDEFELLVRAGRILIGPWFTMPDLFGPGAESLVRNLLLGRKIAKCRGAEPMPVAYTCDMFGHPSQMPQIYAGFDLPYCILGRGTNEHTTPPFFNWLAPDGSSVLCFKLQDAGGYGAFASVRNILEQSSNDPRDELETRAKDALRDYVGHEIKRATCNVLCLMDAMDHTPPATDVKGYLQLLHETIPDLHVKHSTLPAFFQDVAKQLKEIPARHGELREPAKNRHGYLHLLANCVSARVRMKQSNDACQVLLERWAEPWGAFGVTAGYREARGFMDTAWRELLLCHAHDSICGCSIDQVFKDMMNRYERIDIIARQLRNRALGALTANCSSLCREKNDITLTIANPLPVPRREVVEFDIDLPTDWPSRFHESYLAAPDTLAFVIEDADGTLIPYQLLSQTVNYMERTKYAKPALASHGFCHRCRVAAAIELPALGFSSLRVTPAPTPVRRYGTLRTGPAGADNGRIGFDINPNGSINMVHHETGARYRDLLTLCDSSETGDAWRHAGLATDKIVLSTTCDAQTALLEDGPEQVTFAVTLYIRVPKECDLRTQRRSSDEHVLMVENRITLRRTAEQLEVQTTILNNTRDHRLQLLLPTDLAADTYLAHHPYDVVERPIQRDHETETWSEPELTEKPFLDFQAIGDGHHGLAFLAAGGLHEGGVQDDSRRTMQITLLRSFSNTVATSGQEEPQEQGTLAFRYALLPFKGELDVAETMLRVQTLQAGLWTRQDGLMSSGYPAMRGELQPRQSFLELRQHNVVLMAVKQAENGDELILRLWNPAPEETETTIKLLPSIRQARRLKLSEEPAAANSAPPFVNSRDNSVIVSVPGNGIATIGLRAAWESKLA